MPLHAIEADLASGALVEIKPEGAPTGGHVIEMWAVYRTDNPPGPAGRWFIDRLKQAPALPLKRELSRSQPVATKAARRLLSGRLPALKRKRGR
jgi:hypothetical protein